MRRILKLLGIVVAAGLVLLVAVMIGLAYLIDPNDYRDDIVAAVNEATGRELTLEGDLELRIFPALRIAVGPASISNAAGFGDEPFAEIGNAALRIELLPLLGRRIEIGEARLEGLVLNLARNAQGQNNWQDLGRGGAAEPASEPAPEQAAGPGFDLDVAAIEILDASVAWQDVSAGTSWQLQSFNLQASGFGPGQRFPLSMDFQLAGNDVDIGVTARMQATLALAENRYRLDDAAVVVVGEGGQWPGGAGEARLAFDTLDANLGQQTLGLEALELEMLGMTAAGSLAGRQLFDDLTLRGSIEIRTFDPQQLLGQLDIELQTADPGVMRSASASAELVYDSTQMMMNGMQLQLDDSRLDGRLGLVGERLTFDLDIDTINIDRYLPPSEETDSPEEGSLDEVDLPLDALRQLNAAGELAIAEAQFSGLQLSDVAFALTAGDGRLRLTPSAALYGGRYSGQISLDVGADAAALSLQQAVENVQVAPLAGDLMDLEAVTGTGTISLNLTANASNLGVMRRGLDGEVGFTLRDGAWEGFDLWYELRRARAVFNGDSAPPRDGPRRTPFSVVSASGVVEDALLTNRDLNATLPFLVVNGAGTVNLLTDEIDFDLQARVVDGPALQAAPEMADLAGDELPLRVSGTLAEPSVLPDFAALVRARARQEVEERVEEEAEGLRDRLEDRLRGIFDR